MKQIYLLVFIAILHLPRLNAQGFSWAQSFNPTGSLYGAGIATIAFDRTNNAYSIGGFNGTVDVDNGSNAYSFTSVGVINMFLLKEDATGQFIWAKHFAGTTPGSNGLWGRAIDFDGSGNIYIAGTIRDSFDMDPGPGVYNLSTAGAQVGFILKLDSSGNFVWVKRHEVSIPVNNTSGFEGLKIVGDAIYVTGGFAGTVDLDPGPGIISVTSTPGIGGDMLLIKMDTAGNFIWGKQIGGTGIDNAVALATDSTANLYVTGGFQNTVDFNTGTSVNSLISGGDYDVFIAKYDSSGNYVWAKSVGSGSMDFAWNLSLDPFGNILVTGYFGGTVDFDPGPGTYNLTSISGRSIFTLKLRNNGDFAWARMAGAEGRAIATDSAGNVYTTGGFPLTCDFDPGPGTYNLTSNGYYDAFVQKLDSSGNFLWAGSFGGANPNVGDIPTWIGLDHDNSIYVTGVLGGSCDMDPGPYVYNVTASTNSGFILKLCQSAMALNLTASADTACSGDTILLAAPAMAGASYRWYQNGNALSDTTASIQVTTTGSYIVEVNDGCRVYDTVNVTFLPAAAPTISLPGNTLYFAVGQPVTVVASVINGGSGYAIDWYKNGVLFSTTFSNWVSYGKGAGTDTIVAVIRYAVNNPCYLPDTSNAAIIGVIDHVAETAAARIAIAPNPSDGVFTLTAPYAIEQIQVTDIAGKEVYSAAPNSMKAVINLQDKASGVYFYTATIRRNKLRGKLVRK